jgi:hypothetical protein
LSSGMLNDELGILKPAGAVGSILGTSIGETEPLSAKVAF